MRKFFILLTLLFFSIFQNCLANEAYFTLETKYFQTVQENNPKLILALEVDFHENYYTYAPTYLPYPTHFDINEEYTLFYPQTKTSYDPLTDSHLQLYKEKNNYFLLLDSIPEKEQVLEISMLLCSTSNCTPYEYTKTLKFPQNLEDLPLLENSSLYKAFTQSDTLFVEPKIIEEEYETLTNIDFINLETEDFNFTPQAFAASLEVKSLAFAILIGLIAGFILNLMPCVLPVIAIKITSLLQNAQHDGELQHTYIRRHGIFFSLGILTFFTILAVFFGSFDMMWGEIFQNVYFIIILAGFIFMLGLSFLNVFTLPILNIRTPQTKSIRKDAYFQGLVTTLIATPCSGPLLGSVLGFSLTLPLYLLILVFLATGFGMALPYILMAIFPNSIKYIPRSGKWTGVLEKVLAFLLFATTLYLLSIVPETMLFKALIYLFLISIFLYLFTFAERSKHAIIWGLFLFTLHSSLSYMIFRPINDDNKLIWHTYSYSEFIEELSAQNMLVDFTADWCPTCKLLEKTTLSDKNIKDLIEEYDIKLIKVDMTSYSKENEVFLKSLESASIPLVALFPKGIFAHSPILLRDIFTTSELEEALKAHF